MLLAVAPMVPLRAQSWLHHFITVQGDQLMDGEKPFRFISFNIPNLLIVEDNLPFTGTNAWRLPDEFEIRDGLATVRQMGGTVVRTYSIPVWRGDDPPAEASYVLGIDQYNENAFRTFDLALKLANEDGCPPHHSAGEQLEMAGWPRRIRRVPRQIPGRLLDRSAAHRRFRADHPVCLVADKHTDGSALL